MYFEPDSAKVAKNELLLPPVLRKDSHQRRPCHLFPPSGDHFRRGEWGTA